MHRKQNCLRPTFRIAAASALAILAPMSSDFRTFEAAGGEHGNRLQEFICARTGVSRKEAKRLLDARAIFVNHQRIWMARHVLSAGDVVELRSDAHAAARRENPLLILHEDDDYIILDKPAGMLANGPDSAESRLQEHFKNPALQAVHRLDRDTSGCFLIAKSAAACTAMVKVFQERAVAKTYLAIVRGRVPPTLRMIRTPIEGQEAITHIRLMRAVREASLLQIELETGRTHQIRRHLAGTGHPLVGDKQYETRAVENETIRRVRRQMLHASKLSFKHPKTGELIEAAAALPIDFRTTKRALKIG